MLGRSGLTPPNVTVDVDVPFGRIRERLLRARVVALPVRENTYSGATTTLLQAMACGKPVVVTRTAAIARGYHLEDGANCRLVAPGDLAALEQAVTGVLDDPALAAGLGLQGRETVERHLTWARYANEMRELLVDAADGATCFGMTGRGVIARARRGAGAVAREVSTEIDRVRFSRRGAADVALFHEFAPPPTGGGHQFLRALVSELERRGLTVEVNRISAGTRACLFNSFNFDFRRLRRFARDDVRFVHRVDGPIATYRGFDDGTDARIAEINRELADVTIVQSRYSRDAHLALGIELVDPRLISNAADPSIFHAPAEREPLAGRRVRVIATSWSDNPNKGAEVIAWLDRHLDRDRYELTFAGRTGRDVRARSCPGTDRVGTACRRVAAKRRLPGAEPERPLLERAPRGARERASGRLPRERRASGARGRRGRGVRRARGGRGSPRPPRLRARRAPCRDPGDTTRRGCGSLSRGASRVRARSLLAPFARGFVGARTRAWPSHSRLFAVGERTSWSVDEDARHLEATARRLGYDVAPSRWARFATDQAVFLTSHFEALQPRWMQSTHRLATAYLHGRPGTPGYPEFDRAYDALRSAPERFSRIQVTHEEMRELVLEAGVEPSAVHVIAIGIDIEQFPLVTPEYRAAARAALDLPAGRLRGRLVPEGRRRLG